MMKHFRGRHAEQVDLRAMIGTGMGHEDRTCLPAARWVMSGTPGG
jgi:hypothetical protein